MMRNRAVDERRSRGFWARLGIKLAWLAALILALFLLVDRLIMPALVRHGQEAACPGVLGLPLEEAESSLRKAGFDPVLESRRADPAGRVPAGAVLDQQPRPGRVTKQGRRVHLVLSLGVGLSRVPDVRGSSLRQAVGLLAEARLVADTLDLQWRHDSRVGQGSVLSQRPAAGDSLEPGRSVDLTLSLGPAPDWVNTPQVTGLALERARKVLERSGLEALVVSGNGGDKSVVQEQDPAAGTPLVPGSAVDLHLQERSVE